MQKRATVVAASTAVAILLALWLFLAEGEVGSDTGPHESADVQNGIAAGLDVRTGRVSASTNERGDDAQSSDYVARIAGTVVDEWDQPASGGRLRLLRAPPGTKWAAEPIVSPEGRFETEIGFADPARVGLIYIGPKELRSVVEWVDLKPDADVAELTLFAFRAARLRIRVMDATGRTVEGARIAQVPLNMLTGSVLTDSQGWADALVPAEPLSAVRATGPDGTSGQTKGLFLLPGEEREVDIRLLDSALRVPVSLVSGGDANVGGKRMSIRFDLPPTEVVQAIVDGPPIFVDLTPRQRRLSARVWGDGIDATRHSWQDVLKPDLLDGLSIPVGFRSRTTVVVTDARGDPLRNLHVELVRSDSNRTTPRVLRATTDWNGAAQFNALHHGEYVASAFGQQLGRLVVDAPRSVHQLSLMSAGVVGGNYAGPDRIGRTLIGLSVRSESGQTFRWPSAGWHSNARWEVCVPFPAGSSVAIELISSRKTVAGPIECAVGDRQVELPLPTFTQINVRAGKRVRVRGWLQLRREGEAGGKNFPIDKRNSTVVLPRLEPGTYQVFYSTTLWGNSVLGTKHAPVASLVVLDGQTAYEVDVGS